jgi:hypothetical protein
MNRKSTPENPVPIPIFATLRERLQRLTSTPPPPHPDAVTAATEAIASIEADLANERAALALAEERHGDLIVAAIAEGNDKRLELAQRELTDRRQRVAELQVALAAVERRRQQAEEAARADRQAQVRSEVQRLADERRASLVRAQAAMDTFVREVTASNGFFRSMCVVAQKAEWPTGLSPRSLETACMLYLAKQANGQITPRPYLSHDDLQRYPSPVQQHDGAMQMFDRENPSPPEYDDAA